MAPGRDTLEHELLTLSGFRNWAADQAGFAGISLERLALDPPDLLIVDRVADRHFSLAHEVLGHADKRRTLSMSLSLGFTVLGLFFPGTGLVDFLASPLAVRAFTRQQELDADRRAVEILRAMGHDEPRKSLALALQALAATKVRPKEEAPGPLSPHPSLEDRLAALEPLESEAPTVARRRER